MAEDESSRHDPVSQSPCSTQSKSPITLSNADYKIGEDEPIPTTNCGTSTSLERNLRQQTAFPGRRSERVGSPQGRQYCVLLYRASTSKAETAQSVLGHAEALSGAIASVSSRASVLLSGAGHMVAATDQTRSRIANHQDKMEFRAQEIALSSHLCSPHMPMTSTTAPSANVMEQGCDDSQPQKHIPGIQVVITNASHAMLCLTGSNLAFVRLGIQTKSVAVIDAAPGGSDEAQGIRSFVPSDIVLGVDVVGFTMDPEGRRLPWLFKFSWDASLDLRLNPSRHQAKRKHPRTTMAHSEPFSSLFSHM
ncbi:hypothetical protein BKA70DRAFT_1443256 [Coprinopsis sp. MPI-PUGE-AT-0042]|nr:hypothetical protein BKA70DRAFT_1443256 [Coprinopsis sp. MPI-PUGE-AT-0042]